MKKFARLQIHSCFASFSSSDVLLHKEVEQEPIFDRTLRLEKEEGYGDDKVTVYCFEEKTFYNKGLRSRRFMSIMIMIKILDNSLTHLRNWDS